MGITAMSLERLNKYIHPADNILMLGCQNLYNSENYGQIAHEYFLDKVHSIKTIDICGCQGAEIMDLREDLKFNREYSLILQHGTIEHCDCESLYQVFKNIHEACENRAIIIHENPRFNHWPEHGKHFFSVEFYAELAKICDYEVLELCEEPAMGNFETGMNVCCVLRLNDDAKFCTEAKFNKIYKAHIYAK